MAHVIDCRSLSAKIRKKINDEIKGIGFRPGLAVVIVGENPASITYVNNKKKACDEVGIYSEIHRLSAEASTQDVIEVIKGLNTNKDIDAILVQLPLPSHIDKDVILRAIDPDKDVDALSDTNIGKLIQGKEIIAPCTPSGIIRILEEQGIDIDGKRCVIVGRSEIVGKPMACLMLEKNATVTICHSHTNNIEEICRQADILIVAIGKERYITEDMVSDGAVVIDVGINRTQDGRLVGDVDFENVLRKASYITPVPGGVGVMTVTSLLINTVKLARRMRCVNAFPDHKR